MAEPTPLQLDEDDDRFTARVMRYLDGVSDGAEIAAIQQALRESDARCGRFVELLIQARSLGEALRPRLRETTIATPRRRPARASRGVARWAVRLGAAAAIVLLVVGSLAVSLQSSWRHAAAAGGDPVAMIADVRQVVWAAGQNPLSPGEQLRGGFIALESGRIEVTFNSGASVVIDGPAEFGVNSAMHGYLRSGKLHAVVPHSAKGFTIGAPGVAVVDLGTRFALSVQQGQAARVQVLEGKVNLIPDHGEPRLLQQMEAARVGSKGLEVVTITRRSLAPASFDAVLQRLPGEPPAAGPQVIPVTGPNGAVGVSGSIHTSRQVASLLIGFQLPPVQERLGAAVFRVIKASANFQRGQVIDVDLYAVLAADREEAIRRLYTRDGRPGAPALKIAPAFIPADPLQGTEARFDLADLLRRDGPEPPAPRRLFVMLAADRPLDPNLIQRVRIDRRGCAIDWTDSPIGADATQDPNDPTQTGASAGGGAPSSLERRNPR